MSPLPSTSVAEFPGVAFSRGPCVGMGTCWTDKMMWGSGVDTWIFESDRGEWMSTKLWLMHGDSRWALEWRWAPPWTGT